MKGRRTLGRFVRRGRRLILGLDPFRMEQRIRVLEVQLAELRRHLASLDTPERRATDLLAREDAQAIEHLLHENVRTRRDLGALRGED